MALIRNGSHRLSGLSAFHGAVGAAALRGQVDKGGRFKNFDSGEHAVSGVTNRASIPAGARHPIAWRMGTKAGSLASTNEAEGSAEATLAMAAGVNISGSAEGTTPTTQATMQLVVSMIAEAFGEATTNANLSAALGLEGSATGVATDNAIITALAWAIGQSSGSTVATLVSYATGQLQGSITPFTELSPEGLATAVWSAIAAENNTAGTMGNKVNSAASAGDPWTTELPGTYPAGSAGYILGSVDAETLADAILTDPRLLTVAKFLGLK